MRRFVKWAGVFFLVVIAVYASLINQLQQSLVLNIATQTTTYTFKSTDYSILCNAFGR